MRSIEGPLRWAIILGIFAVVLITPFIVTNSLFFPYIVGKALFFRIAVVTLLCLWVALATLNRKYWPRFSWVGLAFTLFVVWIGLATLASQSPVDSFWSNFERMEGYGMLLHTFAFFLVATTVVSAEGLWRRLFQASVAVSAVMAFMALGEFLNDGGRVSATLGNPIYLAGYLLFHIFLSVYLLLGALKDRFYYYAAAYASVALFLVLGIFLTGTRGAQIGLVVGSLIIAVSIAVRRGEELWLRYCAAAAATAAVFMILFVGSLVYINSTPEAQEIGWASSYHEVAQSIPVVSRFSRIDLSAGDARARFLLWQTAWEGIKERPIIGWGPENYLSVFSAHYNPALFDREMWFDRAHNIFLEWGVAGGVLGFLLYLSLFAVAIASLWRSRVGYYTKVAFTALFAAYAVHNFFVFDNTVSYIFLGAILAFVAAVTAASDQEERRDRPVLSSGAVAAGVLPVMVGVMLLVIYGAHVQTLQANKQLMRGLQAVECGAQVLNLPWGDQTAQSAQLVSQSRCEPFLPDDLARSAFGGAVYTPDEMSEHVFSEAVSSFIEAREISPVGEQEAVEQLSIQTRRVMSSGLPLEIQDLFLSKAEEELRMYIQRFPEKTRPRVFLGFLYLQAEDYGGAAEVFETARERSPRRQLILLRLGESYLQLERHEIARDLFREAHELDRSFSEPRLRYAAAERSLGNEERVAEILEPLSEREVIFSDELLEPFLAAGEYEPIIETRQRRIDILLDDHEEHNRDSMVRIGREYLRLIEDLFTGVGAPAAVRKAEELVEHFPEFERDVERVIEDIQSR